MFYDNFVRLCSEVGKSPSAVAVEIGLQKSAVTYWKNGRSNPSDVNLQKIADYFGVSLEELLYGGAESSGVVFYSNFIKLCNNLNRAPSSVVEELGLQRSAVTKWSKGAFPRNATLQKIADYFGVTVEDLITDASEQKEKPAAQSSEPRDPLIAELVSYAEGADEDGVRMLIEMAKRLKDSRRG